MSIAKTVIAAFLLWFRFEADAFKPAATRKVTARLVQQTALQVSLADLGVDDDDEDDEDTRDIIAQALLDDDDDYDMDNPPPEDFILNEGDLEEEDDDEFGSEDDGVPPEWYSLAERIEELRLKYRRHETDTGSPEYQVAGMTERIAYLTKHLKVHPKDFSTRRGLVALVNKRRRLLNFLANEDVARYKSLVSSLGIRHKASGRILSRQEKYGRFPPQKKPKKHLVKKKMKQQMKKMKK